MLLVTINTNKAPNTAMQEQFYIDGLREFIERTLNTIDSWRRVLTVQPSFNDAIDHIDVDAIGIERGEERHRMHAHFVVTIQHHGKVMLTKNTNWLWKKLADENLNYVTKNSGGIKQIATLGVQPIESF